MKKLLSLVIVIVCLVAATPAQAQLKFGLKGGLNVSKVSFSTDVFKGDNRTGFFVGPMAEFTVPILGLGIDAAALYTQSGAKVSYGNGSDDKTLKAIEVPVNLKYTFGLGSTLGVFVAAGPQFGFNIGSGNFSGLDLKSNYTTFNVGAGVKLIQHLQVELNYNFSLSKLGKYQDEDGILEMKRNTWQISLAYLF